MRRDFNEICRDMVDQDNYSTQHPVFVVQELVRIYGLDPDYSDKCVYVDVDGEEIEDSSSVSALDENVSAFYTGYLDQWVPVQFFLTENGAQDYIDHNKHRHRHGWLRIYVDSAHRNEELKTVRSSLMGMVDHADES